MHLEGEKDGRAISVNRRGKKTKKETNKRGKRDCAPQDAVEDNRIMSQVVSLPKASRFRSIVHPRYLCSFLPQHPGMHNLV
jgi:hypothetical protein